MKSYAPPTEEMKDLASYYHKIIKDIGEDPSREGLLKTPERAARAISFLTQGYKQDGGEILRSAMFKEDYSQMVMRTSFTAFFRTGTYCIYT
jgi:GTP cyclohydrolase I